MLTRAVREEAQLNNLGRTIAHGLLVRIIRYRFALGRHWRENPGILRTRLAPPIIVVGQMRGGTTRLHRLLAADPGHGATRFCDAWHPIERGLLPQPARGAIDLFWTRLLDPWMDVLHPMGATKAEEELGWLAQGLAGSTFYTQWHIPSYVSYCEEADPTPIYAEFARILRTDTARRGNAERPRVLKVPEFTEALTALTAEFPDARLTVARRDGDAVARSAASLVANQMAIMSDHADFAQIEAEWTSKIGLREERVAAFLQGWTGPVSVVEFDALDRDWEAAITKVYADLGLSLSHEAILSMRKIHRAGQTGNHHLHAEQIRKFRDTNAMSQSGGDPQARSP